MGSCILSLSPPVQPAARAEGIDRLNDFLRRNGLRWTRRKICPHGVSNGRSCSPTCPLLERGGWADHLEVYLPDQSTDQRKAVLVGHPYGLSDWHFETIDKIRKLGLNVNCFGAGDWYAPGSAWLFTVSAQPTY